MNKIPLSCFIDSVKEYADNKVFPFLKEMGKYSTHLKDGEAIVDHQINKYMKQVEEIGFYRCLFFLMKFYYKYELPKTVGLAELLMNQEALTLNTDTKIFA